MFAPEQLLRDIVTLFPIRCRQRIDRDRVITRDPRSANVRKWGVYPIVSTNRTTATIIGIVMRRISITVTKPLIEATTRCAY